MTNFVDRQILSLYLYTEGTKNLYSLFLPGCQGDHRTETSINYVHFRGCEGNASPLAFCDGNQ